MIINDFTNLRKVKDVNEIKKGTAIQYVYPSPFGLLN